LVDMKIRGKGTPIEIVMDLYWNYKGLYHYKNIENIIFLKLHTIYC
jgi:hypothetical protein